MNEAYNNKLPGIDMKDLAAMALGIDPDELRDAVIIGAIDCKGCERPHLIKQASTSTDPSMALLIMALAITDILDKYGKEALPDER